MRAFNLLLDVCKVFTVQTNRKARKGRKGTAMLKALAQEKSEIRFGRFRSSGLPDLMRDADSLRDLRALR